MFVALLGIRSVLLRNHPQPPLLTADPDSLAFGPVWTQEAYRHVVRIQNSSDTPVEAEFEASGTCTSAEPAIVRIPPNGVAKIVITADLSRRSKDTFTRTLMATTTTGSKFQWDLEGTVRDLITAQPSTVRFAGQSAITPADRQPTSKVLVRSVVPLRGFESASDDLLVDATAISSNEFDLAITPAIGHFTEDFEAVLRLKPISASAEKSWDA